MLRITNYRLFVTVLAHGRLENRVLEVQTSGPKQLPTAKIQTLPCWVQLCEWRNPPLHLSSESNREAHFKHRSPCSMYDVTGDGSATNRRLRLG